MDQTGAPKSLDHVLHHSSAARMPELEGSALIQFSQHALASLKYNLVQEGYDVMTGGGPGTMEGANRGAYEAGGTSIGVVLKLPNEKRGNGYQTLTLKHRNFFTRMENLKKADLFIAEDGGIGTGAEALDTLTHIQTGKLKEVPIYGVGKKNYGLMDKWLSAMQKGGTISPSDRKLYRLVDDPDQIFVDLKRRQAQAQAQKAAADAGASPTDKPLKPAGAAT